MNHPPTAIELNPARFYALVDLLKSEQENPERTALIETTKGQLDALLVTLDSQVEELVRTESALLHEARMSTRREKAFSSSLEQEDIFKETKSYRSFLRIVTETARGFQEQFRTLRDTLGRLEPGVLILSENKFTNTPKSFEALQHMATELTMNRPTLEAYVAGLQRARSMRMEVIGIGRAIIGFLDEYYQALVDRHSVQGIKVHRDAVATDVAIAIYENVDAHGEIDSGAAAGELSAYSARKATLLAEALKKDFVHGLIEFPDSFTEFVKTTLTDLWETANAVHEFLKVPFEKLDKISSQFKYEGSRYSARISNADFEDLLVRIDDLDPSTVPYKDKQVLLSKEERFSMDFRNETLEAIVKLLVTDLASPHDLIRYVLERKEQLRKYFQDENSFYTCKISSGNPFLGEAPGALKVIPSQRPNARLDEILGSGFEEVKGFIQSVEAGAKWHDLFLATSPSKTADKSNVLLVGPQGCHRKGQLILMFNGTTKKVEDIRVGDALMGPDSTSRTVLKLHRGIDKMVEISPTKGEPWVVNKEHILTLVRMGRKKLSGEVRDVSISDYMSWSDYMKREFKLFRVGVDFTPQSSLKLDPYFLGALLGDGSITACPGLTTGDVELVQEVYAQAGNFALRVNPFPDSTSSVTRYYLSGVSHLPNPIMTILRELDLGGRETSTKFIPHVYKTSSREDRLNLLAGIIDTDGSLGCNTFDFQSKSESLAKDVAFVARSLGFAAPRVRLFQRTDSKGVQRTYYRVKISGDLDEIPTRLQHKKAKNRKQIKDVLRTGLTLRELPTEKYYGFTVDGDHRYLLEDFTVTHNCGKSEVLRAVGADPGSISVFAQGSDFLTCWKGESEKNPKRLFEEGLRLQKESRKHVHFLIDEIDAVLNNDRDHTSTNLTLEFQILMDGVVQYPNLSVWGATNHFERIPMPMIRRFNKVAIVGELDQTDRIKLLKHFVGFLPTKEFGNNGDPKWPAMAKRLEGATGDVIRKIADHLWREKMTEFVTTHNNEADQLLKWLNDPTENDGHSFQIASFSKKRREQLVTKLEKFISVTPKDLDVAISMHLANQAIHHEIATAVKTYARAKEFLQKVQGSQIKQAEEATAEKTAP